MHPTTYQRERRRLAEWLRELRESAGISGSQFAAQRGWVQPRVSRIETGRQLPTEDDLDAWVALAGAGPDVRAALGESLERARAEYANWREAFRAAGSGAAAQGDIRTREESTTHLRMFLPAMVPGLLQTRAYAGELLALPTGPAAHGADETDIAEILSTRMTRQDILYQPGRRIEIVVMQAALRARLCSPEALAGQLARLAAAAVAGGGVLEFGVIPDEAPLPVYPLSGFTIYDEGLVTIETMAGEHQVSGAEDIATYARFFKLIRDVAVTGQDAVNVIGRVSAELEGEG